MRFWILLLATVAASVAMAGGHKQQTKPDNYGQQRSAEQHRVNEQRQARQREEVAERKGSKTTDEAEGERDRDRDREPKEEPRGADEPAAKGNMNSGGKQQLPGSEKRGKQ